MRSAILYCVVFSVHKVQSTTLFEYLQFAFCCILDECNGLKRKRENHEPNEGIIARFASPLKFEGKWWIKSAHKKKNNNKKKNKMFCCDMARYQVPNSKYWINKITDELEDVENIPLNDVHPMEIRTKTLKNEQWTVNRKRNPTLYKLFFISKSNFKRKVCRLPVLGSEEKRNEEENNKTKKYIII